MTVSLLVIVGLFIASKYSVSDSDADGVESSSSIRRESAKTAVKGGGHPGEEKASPPRDGDESNSGREWLRESMADQARASEDIFEHLLGLGDRRLQAILLKEFFRKLGIDGDVIGFELIDRLRPGEIRSYSFGEFVSQFAPKDSASLIAALDWSRENALPNELAMFTGSRLLRNLDLDENSRFLVSSAAGLHPHLAT